MADWRWEETTRRYRDQSSGRYMSRDAVLSYVEQSISASENVGSDLAKLVGGGQLSPADFGDLARQEIKEQYITQYLLGRGGREAMTPADWGTVGHQLRDQYAFFRDFQAEIAAGNLSQAQITARMKMYVDSSRQAYEAAHQRNAKALGYDEEHWWLGAVLTEHCPDCENYQAMDWQPIGTFPEPGDGSTQCLTNCACMKTFRNGETGEEWEG